PQLAIAQLEAADSAGTAISLLNRLAVLAPTGVTHDLLALDGVSEPDTRQGLAMLYDRALATPSADGQSVGQHRLIQRVRREQLAPARQLPPALASAAAAVSAVLVPPNAGAWQRRGALENQITHIDALWAAATTTINQPQPNDDLALTLLTLRIA